MTRLHPFGLAVGAAVLAFGAQAADFPAAGKTITIVVPFAAGGPTDKVARDLGEALRKPLGGATIVIDNAAGAGSTIGSAKVARANPDGYTLLLTHIGMATTAALYRKLPFNVQRLRVPGHHQRGADGGDRQVDPGGQQLGRAQELDPGQQDQGQPGQRRPGRRLAPVRPDAAAGAADRHDHRALQGTAPAMADLMGGQVDVMCDQTTNTTSQIEGKKVKAYAVTTAKRLAIPAV
jgi:tripartite-type tricarboxylate transporter receptor subunit TctC